MKHKKWGLAILAIVNIIYPLAALLATGRLYRFVYFFTFEYNWVGALLWLVALYHWYPENRNSLALGRLMLITIVDFVFYLMLRFQFVSIPQIVCVMASCVNLAVFISCYRKIDSFEKSQRYTAANFERKY